MLASNLNTKIIIKPDCGNSPKMQFIKEFNIAFAEDDLNKISSMIANDIEWTMVGEKVMKGKKEVTSYLYDNQGTVMTEVTINNIITHGKVASANGVMKFLDDNMFSFCDVYEFENHKTDSLIKNITTYLIKIS